MAKTDGSDLVKKDKTPAKKATVVDWINSMKPELARALPNGKDADRMARIALTAIRLNKKLQEADPLSFVAALMTSAQLGLEPNTPLGEAYLIPYGKQVQFQLGYRGILEMAYRTGEYQTIYAMEVYPNDKFFYQYGLNPDLIHVPDPEPEGEPVFYYAIYRLKGGGSSFVVWSTEKVKKHADRFSQAYRSGKGSPWQTDFDAMAKKTVLKALLNYAPKSVSFARAIAQDETVRREYGEDMTVIPDEKHELEEEAEFIDVEAELMEEHAVELVEEIFDGEEVQDEGAGEKA